MNSDSQHERRLGSYQSFSQAYQDLFVRLMTQFKIGGSYFEIGAGHPQESNNTYILERDLRWVGVSLEKDPHLCSTFSQLRRNPCYQLDALQADYESIFATNNLPQQIDYLSIDIEPASVTLQALKRLPLKSFRFSVITFEHDFYSQGQTAMNEAREILSGLNYRRVVSNVKSFGRDFEDWYVDPSVIAESIYGPLLSEGKECKEVFAFLPGGSEA